MESNSARRAWLLMAAGDNRGHGGNAGYDDQYDAYYSWDSKVPNHRNLRTGDPIALWDKERLLGVSVIEEIETRRGPKVLNRCPACHKTRIHERTTVEPRWRCSKCFHEFPTPDVTVVEVDQYVARYDAAWTSLHGLLRKDEIRSVQMNAIDINAMRPLDWAAFSEVLTVKDAARAVERVAARIELSWLPPSGPRVDMPQGFSHTLVRVRRGQQQFREKTLAAQGSVCAFTGAAPQRVLEAGHLYSYAQIGTHFEHGGLMLRRDVHRLFDDGLIAVDPSRLRIDVGSELTQFPQYARLHDEHLNVALRDEQVDWLGKHWEEHRAPMAPAPIERHRSLTAPSVETP
ncbi:HNH endonuclease signature motif containing protein [Oerskovia merdavium]|uniref:HNH endonuclease n=1 Tax=Oerskovia merdavium TaxID=2762227 RepID=A0ABR8U1Z5_9CELL|nr:HNH endonuclease signature motif containing protein [Oerskovia merdavium]MBD7981569.1 HNH endonuclease [Oerskovia merdavium]